MSHQSNEQTSNEHIVENSLGWIENLRPMGSGENVDIHRPEGERVVSVFDILEADEASELSKNS